MNEVLEEIGLNKNEAKVYISLLNLGQSTVTKISDTSKLHRTNVYDTLKKLIERGLVSYIRKGDVAYYEANNPEHLLRILEEKESKLKAILPQLQLSKSFVTKGTATVHDGIPSFVNILHDFLSYKQPIFAYGIPSTAPEMMKHKLVHFHQLRIKLKVPMKHIYNFSAQDRIKLLNSMPYTFAKYLPQSFDSQVSTNICGDEVVLVLWSKPVLSIRIQSKLLSDSYKKYFSLLWKAAT